ncbi:recombinase family protein [Labrys wisconsinensis]|uniref:DNA invertase Pin-like site-specific DNA recombinase n=1 Tax=Labrys wisconsinensis TaxID=425677 RepID=A0ABU0JFQ6_9HYPH|nr:recombinase family protein [Labrys wisconsinensis]MDQ0473127.1 DNA invertase Pin-like site-specific DNA recombinase [Labrys wisconsinensis]
MRTAIAYIRVPAAGQKRPGLDIEAQRRTLRSFAEAEGIRIIGEHIEVDAGRGGEAIEHRPHLAAAMASARVARCPILVSRLDRLSGDVAVISGLMAQEIPFVIAEAGVEALPFMMRLYDELPPKARTLISERTKAALAAPRLDGRRPGNPRLVETAAVLGRAAVKANADAFAASLVPVIETIQASGITSYDAIAAALNARGIHTRRQGKWHAATVRNLLLRKVNLAAR